MKIARAERSYSTQLYHKPKNVNCFKQPVNTQIFCKKDLLKNMQSNSLHYLYPMQSSYCSPDRTEVQPKQSNKQIYLQKNYRQVRQETQKTKLKNESIKNSNSPSPFQENQNSQAELIKVMSNLTESVAKLAQQFNSLSEKINSQGSSEIGKITNKIDTLIHFSKSHHATNQRFSFNLYADSRYQNMELQIPNLPILGEQRNQKIEQYLGIACKKIFSVGFGLLHKQQLTTNGVKVFCSQQLLFWIIKTIKKNFLTVSEICIINQCMMEKILPYFSSKYPASNQVGENMQLSSLIVERKNIEENENDFLKKNDIFFRYNKSGNYSSSIMKVINKILLIIREKKEYDSLYIQQRSKKETLFDRFQEDVTSLFRKLQSKEQVQEMQSYQMNKTIFEQDLVSLLKKGSFNQEIDNLRGTCRRSFINIDTKKKQDMNQTEAANNFDEYKEHVKSYTKYEINKKVKDHIKPYSEKQILDEDFKLTDTGMIRLLTKWTEQLELCFDEKTTILRQHPFKMRNGQISYLQRQQIILLYKLLQKNKKNVQQYRKKVNQHMSQTQFEVINRQISGKLKAYTQQESLIGHFSTLMFKNSQSYLKGYLNILIHSICSALDQFQKIIRSKDMLGLSNCSVYEIENININELLAKVQKLPQNDNDVEQMIPQLITFTVGDLFRCKCSSKQKEITALYKEIQKINQQKPHIFKIVRVKNKLKEATKDILVNLLYRQKLLVEVQLSIKSDKTKFISHQFDFKHYLYQLQRGLFGPIHELCSTWVSKDPRSEIYLSKFQQLNERRYSQIEYSCSHRNKSLIKFPFKCSLCQYYYQDPKTINSHLQCENSRCKHRRICFICQLQKQATNKLSNNALVDAILAKTLHKNIFYYKRGQQKQLQKKFPFRGYLVNLKNAQNKRCPFVKFQQNRHLYLLEPLKQGKDFRLIKQISLENHHNQLKKFLSENIIIADNPPEFSQYTSDKQITEKIELNYFIPKYFRSCIKNERNSITLSHRKLQNDQIFKCKSGDFKFVKSINLSDNCISSIENIAKSFSQVQILNLSNNQIENLPKDLSNFVSLEKLSLDKNKKLKYIPQQIFLSPNLELIEVNDCSISHLTLPKYIPNYSRLKTLQIDDNYLEQIPNEIQNLQNLKVLSASNNKIGYVSRNISNLRFLKSLNLSKNHNIKLPEEIGQLMMLQKLEISQCSLQYLPLKVSNLKNLKVLNLQFNNFNVLQQQICELESLEKLNFSNNNLQIIIPHIKKLKKLKYLNLEHNPRIKCLPGQIGELKELKSIILNAESSNKKKIEINKSVFQLALQNICTLNNQIDKEPSKKFQIKELEDWCIKINEPQHNK